MKIGKVVIDKNRLVDGYYLNVDERDYSPSQHNPQVTHGFKFYDSPDIPFSEDVDSFGAERYFHYLLYLNDLIEDGKSRVLEQIRGNSGRIELHHGNRKEVVEQLLHEGYAIHEYIPMAYATDAFPDFRFRFFIAQKDGETIYVISSTADSRIKQMESVLIHCGLMEVTHREYRQIGKYAEILDGLGNSEIMVMGARHGLYQFLMREEVDLERKLIDFGDDIEEFSKDFLSRLEERLGKGPFYDSVALYLKSYQFKKVFNLLRRPNLKSLEVDHINLLIRYNDMIKWLMEQHPELDFLKDYRLFESQISIRGIYDEDYGRFDVISIRGTPIILAPISYGRNAVELYEAAIRKGVKVVIATGSVGGLSGGFGLIVAPKQIVIGCNKVSIDNLFSEHPNIFPTTHTHIDSIVDENKSWINSALGMNIQTVDCEMGLLGLHHGKDVRLGLIGVVTDVLTEEQNKKLKISQEQRRLLRQAFISRDALILEELRKIN